MPSGALRGCAPALRMRFGDLEIVNPFADAAHQPRPAYAARKRFAPVKGGRK
jgi:hypothetical protein